jgi:hypothetical protein
MNTVRNTGELGLSFPSLAFLLRKLCFIPSTPQHHPPPTHKCKSVHIRLKVAKQSAYNPKARPKELFQCTKYDRIGENMLKLSHEVALNVLIFNIILGTARKL